MNAVAGYRHPSSVKARWIPAFAGMTVRTAQSGTPSSVIPAKAGIL